MNKKLLLIFPLLTTLFFVSCQSSHIPHAEDGKIDLRTHSFKKHPILKLTGKWHFFPGILMDELGDITDAAPRSLSVPGSWKDIIETSDTNPAFGYGTYELTLLLPPEIDSLSLSAPQTVTSYRLWVNGIPHGSVGKPGKTEEVSIPRISSRLIHFKAQDSIRLNIEVSNYHICTQHIGGGLGSVLIGPTREMNIRRLKTMFSDAVLIGGFLFISLLLLIFYGAYRRDSSYLFLASFIFILTLRFLATNSKVFFEFLLSDAVPWEWMQRLEMLGYYGATPLILLYVYSLFSSSQKKYYFGVRILVSLDIVFIILLAVTPPRIFMHTLDVFHIIALLHMMYILRIIILSYRQDEQKETSVLIGISLVIFFIFALLDILNTSLLLGRFTTYFSAQGLIIFVLIQGWLLARKYMGMYSAVEESERLTKKHMEIIELYTRKSIVDHIKNGFNPLSIDAATVCTNILFSDIRDFTAFSEDLTPMETVQMLNRYFNVMSKCITRNNGEIDKLIGDCIMALFVNSDDAVNAAVDMRIRLREMNRTSANVRLYNGVGINFGEVVMGNIGSYSKLDYTVIGDSVNSASHIESLTKYYNLPVLISEDILTVLRTPHKTRFIDRVLVKGRKEPIAVYEVYDHEPQWVQDLKTDIQKTHEKAFSLYSQGDFSKALKIYEELAHDLGPHTHRENLCKDPLVDFCIQRCREFLKKAHRGAMTDWNGVYVFKTQ
ncbi:MAG: adenylate/guanylate cyclase domain-containing protein [Fibrobacterota bacterium]